MKLVLDSNILFTFFWEKAVIHTILEQNILFYAPEFALEEIKKYKQEIKQKTKLSEADFKEKQKLLTVRISFIPPKMYTSFLSQALHISPDKEDIDFIALTIALDCGLWSNDNALKEIQKIDIYSTKELIELLDI